MRRLMVAILLGITAHAWSAPADDKSLAQWIEQLSSGDETHATAAAIHIEDTADTQLPAIEEASRRRDISAGAAETLERIADRQKRRVALRQRNERLDAETAQKNGAALLAAYDKFGSHNPNWDAPARQYIDFFAKPGSDADQKKRMVPMSILADKITAAGCDDLLVNYLMLRVKSLEPLADLGAVVAEMRDNVDAIEASNLPAQRKCWAHARLAELVAKKQLWDRAGGGKKVTEDVDLAIAEWPDTLKDPATTDRAATQLADTLMYDWQMTHGPNGTYGDRGALCEKIMPAWMEAAPKSAAPLVFKAKEYAQWAWHARGTGVANTVTEDGWRLMRERLTAADEALTLANKLDPADPRIGTTMLTVVLGLQQPRAIMDFWWKQAMDADPDNREACTSKLYYLEPKWYGSAEDMVAFGRECLAAGNFRGRIATMPVDAHWSASQYANKEAYYNDEQVWSDLQKVYEPMLLAYPDDVYDRSYYASYAARCGKWNVADRLFKQLGDQPDWSAFTSREAYDFLAGKAREMVKDSAK